MEYHKLLFHFCVQNEMDHLGFQLGDKGKRNKLGHLGHDDQI